MGGHARAIAAAGARQGEPLRRRPPIAVQRLHAADGRVARELRHRLQDQHGIGGLCGLCSELEHRARVLLSTERARVDINMTASDEGEPVTIKWSYQTHLTRFARLFAERHGEADPTWLKATEIRSLALAMELTDSAAGINTIKRQLKVLKKKGRGSHPRGGRHRRGGGSSREHCRRARARAWARAGAGPGAGARVCRSPVRPAPEPHRPPLLRA
mmetsp:Transcript_36194/g.89908  ORF Transcript_36194/g.89908 Transcript_36194/m.89908 type:complete len:215 (+) Transcript_36194:297-941(+)